MTHLQLCIPPPEPNGIPQFQLAAAIDKTWGKRQLRVRFLSGDTQIRTKVAEIAKKWEEHCDVNFKFVDSGVSDVRVNIDASGRSWSNLGTDALLVAANSPTMNFGWLTQSSSDTEYNRVVLHEFGHALGLIHEHRSPAANIPWNKPVVRDYYITELGWTAQEVERNIFDSADVSTTNFSDFDPQSIMLYSIPNEHTIGNFSVGWNTVLSSRDKSFVGEVYPNSAKGYQEAHRRLRSVWRMPVPAGAPAIEELQFPRGSIANQLQVVSGRSIEAKWIGYIIHHVVGNHPNADGYKELHRRLSQV